MGNKDILNIALADDDIDDRMLFKEAIEEIGIKTNLLLFNNGQELMDHLNIPSIILPNLIFLDLNMPVKNGMQCLTEIRKNPKFKDISIAIYSTSSSEKDIENTFVNGANIYLNKPNNFSKLQESVERVLHLDWQYHTSNLNKDNFLFRL
ncbi:response regulator [Maribacter hydrothermalis]|uniref:Transcriptional regulator n=1 Tax=Maribacter hydrothermalis TaxID=1836467 RepID=A0A1B7Z1C4_9FLAO|nr:response regulator [Maribacter hydrothermalis]APQ18162.1 response regulator [Maribacter hydrothermalis]OBR36509.1 transcriptional regulator [Maribacter hydrothermalis]